MPDPAVAEPPVTTSSFSTKPSFLEDPALNREFEDALSKDGKLSPTVPKLEDPAVIAPAPDKPPEQPKPDEKPAEKPDATKSGEATPPKEDDEIPGDIKSPAAQSSWKRLKEAKKAIETERDSIRTERDRLKAEFEALKKTATTPQQKANLAEDPEYQALKATVAAKEKEANELSERLRLVDVEQHPKFKAYFDSKVASQMDIAKNIGGDKLVDALKLPDGEYRREKLNEIASELDPVSLSQLGSVMTRLVEINAEKAGEIAKARESYAQIQAEQQAQGEKQRSELLNTFQRVTADVTDPEKGLAVFREREGDEEWNKGVRERLALAQHAFEGKLKPEDAARAIYWSAAAPQFLQHNNALVAKVAELEKTIAQLQAATPTPGGGGSDPDQTIPSTKTGLDALMDDIAKVLPGPR